MNHSLTFTYAELPARFQSGDEVGYTCRYSDTLEVSSEGTFIYGQQQAPDAPVTDDAARAREAFYAEVDRWFPNPTATGQPQLTNQRVGFPTWLVVTGLDVPRTVERPDLGLALHAEVSDATIAVPVADSKDPVEEFPCPSEKGDDTGPNGECIHAFRRATRGTQTATITIKYDVFYSSAFTGQRNEYIGPITRTGTVLMDVKDLQATAS